MSDFSSFFSGLFVGNLLADTPTATAPVVVPVPVREEVRISYLPIQNLLEQLPTLPGPVNEEDLDYPYQPTQERDWAIRTVDGVPVFPRWGRDFVSAREYAFYLPAGVQVEFLLANGQKSPRKASVGGWVIVKIPLVGERTISPVLVTEEKVIEHLSAVTLDVVRAIPVGELAPSDWWSPLLRGQVPYEEWVDGAGFETN